LAGVEAVQADTSDPASLDAAFDRVELVYACSLPDEAAMACTLGTDGARPTMPTEKEQGIALADAAHRAGARIFFW
jgi:hypothetical protein